MCSVLSELHISCFFDWCLTLHKVHSVTVTDVLTTNTGQNRTFIVDVSNRLCQS